MKNKLIYCLPLIVILSTLMFDGASYAKGPSVHAKKAIIQINQMEQDLQNNQMEKSKQEFQSFKHWWSINELEVKEDSLDAYIEIERQTGKVSLDLLNNQVTKAQSDLAQLKTSVQQYQTGTFQNQGNGKQQSLAAYIQSLEKTKQLLQKKKWAQAERQIRGLQRQWLSVEGDVVSQSKKAYNTSENNLVLMAAYVSNPVQRSQTIHLVDGMIFSLKPLAHTNYGLMDAALIPIREGLEALLVVGALLTFARKAESVKARRWVWGGTLCAIGVCVGVGILVSLLLSSSAFGANNSLINGVAGVTASAMLLYVSYWLHRNSNVHRWNHYIRSNSEKAMTNGRMVSFAILAFLAVLREGMETVIFLIGMAGRMSSLELAGGIVLGFAVLVAIGFLMMRIGVRLPLKPFFLFSSLIVFYLCLKFMGSGIHSLQMAGILPSQVWDYLPSISFLSVFPSWYSALPQMLFLCCGIAFFLKNQWSKRKTAP